MLAMVRRIVAEEGVGAFWKGTAPVIGKQAVNSGVRFTTFGLLQDKVAKRWPALHGRVGTTLVIGAISGVVTVCVFATFFGCPVLRCRFMRLIYRTLTNDRYASMPFDNIKTQVQSTSSEHKGMVQCALKILRTGGVGGFWRGTSPRLARLTVSPKRMYATLEWGASANLI
jgi:solute carrier family 25 citrate transporter 1